MPTGASGQGGGRRDVIAHSLIAVAAVAFGGWAVAGMDNRQEAEQAERQKLVDAFRAAHEVEMPPILSIVPPGVYSGVEIQTPKGPEICKITITQDATHARTRHVVPSDCQPK